MAGLNGGGVAAMTALAARVTDLEAASGDVAFGNDVVGVTLQTLTSNTKMVGKMTTGAAGQVPYLDIWLDGSGGSIGSQSVKAVLFADDGTGNFPATLLAQSAQQTITNGQAGAWVRFNLLTVPNVTEGQVLWGGWHAGTTGAVGRYAIGAGSALRYNSDTLSDGTTSPFGTPTSVGQTLSVRSVVQDNTASQIAALEDDIAALELADADIDGRLDALETGDTGGSTVTKTQFAAFPFPASGVVESDPFETAAGGTMVVASAVGDQTITSVQIQDSLDGATWRTHTGGASAVVQRPYAKVKVTNGATVQGDSEASVATA